MNIKDYLKYYIGCPLTIAASFTQNLHGKLVSITMKEPFWICLVQLPDGAIVDTEELYWNDHFGYSKPILRRIESLTEEEKKPIWALWHDAVLFNQGWVAFAPEQFHYLLSLGIDLFGLIEAGLAVDADTLNQQTEAK